MGFTIQLTGHQDQVCDLDNQALNFMNWKKDLENAVQNGTLENIERLLAYAEKYILPKDTLPVVNECRNLANEKGWESIEQKLQAMIDKNIHHILA